VPDEAAAAPQPLRIQTQPIGVRPQNLDPIASPAAKHEQLPRKWIPRQAAVESAPRVRQIPSSCPSRRRRALRPAGRSSLFGRERPQHHLDLRRRGLPNTRTRTPRSSSISIDPARSFAGTLTGTSFAAVLPDTRRVRLLSSPCPCCRPNVSVATGSFSPTVYVSVDPPNGHVLRVRLRATRLRDASAKSRPPWEDAYCSPKSLPK
jgi:hypothetical protein